MDILDPVPELKDAHHDLAVLPGGIVATLLWSGESSAASDLVERSPDGTVRIVVRIADNVFGRRNSYHSNSVAYYAADNAYTVGDLDAGGYAKLTRDGKLLWRFVSADLLGNHGHHLLAGGILVFKARRTPSPVYEYRLTESSGALSASQIWSYNPGNNLGSIILGDVQRLPNGNTLIDYSVAGEMREISPAGAVVETIQAITPLGNRRQFGYADFRPTLYGRPLR